jgi:hypothetical protein
LILTGPGLAGRGSVGTDTLLDWDPLYSTDSFPPLPATYDYSSIVLDYPRDLAFARGLHAGRVDLWNPLVAQGTPLWAEQGGPFFPLALPFYLWPARQTYHLFLALRLVLGALGSFALARARGLTLTGSFAAGACFELSGVSIAHLPFASASATYVLPWVVLGAHVLARAPRFASAAAAACALGLAGHAGHPTIVLLVLSAFAAAAAGHVAAAWRTPRFALAIATWSGVALLLGLGLAAPRLLPLAELTSVGHTYKREAEGEKIRATMLDQARQAMPIALLAPGALDAGSRVFGAVGPFGAAVGALGLASALAGLVCGRLGAGLTAVLVLGVALSLSPPGLAWVGHLPGLSLVLPIYAPGLIALVLAQCAGRGVEAAREARGRRALLAGLAVTFAGGAALLAIDLREWWPRGAEIVRNARSSPQAALRLLLPAVVLPAVAVFAALGRKSWQRFAPTALAALIVAEQLANVLPLAHLPASKVLSSPPSPAVKFLQERLAGGDSRLLGTSMRIGFPHTPSIFGLADGRGVFALAVRRYADYLGLVGPKSISTTLHAPQPAKSPLVDLAAIRWIVSTDTSAADADTGVAYRDSHVAILENRAALPRVRIVHRSSAAADREGAMRWLESAAARARHARDTDLASRVVLEPSAAGDPPPVLSGSTPAGEEARIVEHDDPDRLVVEARLAEAGLIVIADTYYPGWRATVDGRPAAIHPADLLFRAVHVERGSHRVELRYQPASFRSGLLLFIAASLICLVPLMRRAPSAS